MARQIALEAGNLLHEGFRSLKSGDIALKGFGDYVTAMDHASEALILKAIRNAFPEHQIYAEESGADCRESDYLWLIDPLDGTANYVHGIPFYSVSIAVQYKKEIIAGVVYHVEQEELFHAGLNQGAWLNGEPVHVSTRPSLGQSMLGTGFPWRSKPYIDAYVKAFHHMFSCAAGMRRMGSAAIDLSYVACGRLDGFWEMHLRPYDIAAGVLLTREAGGIVTDFNGSASVVSSGNVVASNPVIHEQFLDVTSRFLSKVPGVGNLDSCL